MEGFHDFGIAHRGHEPVRDWGARAPRPQCLAPSPNTVELQAPVSVGGAPADAPLRAVVLSEPEAEGGRAPHSEVWFMERLVLCGAQQSLPTKHTKGTNGKSVVISIS